MMFGVIDTASVPAQPLTRTRRIKMELILTVMANDRPGIVRIEFPADKAEAVKSAATPAR